MTALNPVLKVGDQISEMLKIHTSMTASERKARVIRAMNDVDLPDPKDVQIIPPPIIRRTKTKDNDSHGSSHGTRPSHCRRTHNCLRCDNTSKYLEAHQRNTKTQRYGRIIYNHDFGVVADIADRVVVMQEGKIVEQGTVNRFLRILPTNILKC